MSGKMEVISRRKALLSLLGLALAGPATVLTLTQAEAQAPGTQPGGPAGTPPPGLTVLLVHHPVRKPAQSGVRHGVHAGSTDVLSVAQPAEQLASSDARCGRVGRNSNSASALE